MTFVTNFVIKIDTIIGQVIKDTRIPKTALEATPEMLGALENIRQTVQIGKHNVAAVLSCNKPSDNHYVL
jgi:hypothetical protein